MQQFGCAEEEDGRDGDTKCGEKLVLLNMMKELRRGCRSRMSTFKRSVYVRTGLALAFEVGAGRYWRWKRKGGRGLRVLKRQEIGSAARCWCKECLWRRDVRREWTRLVGQRLVFVFYSSTKVQV